ncbi:MAG TPA: signal peptide peptidase SppA [Candidatus Sumerlaeota bacterium]|nr:signal peptide peptidase SppA [Candidatus Sumerlaeota bacterium]
MRRLNPLLLVPLLFALPACITLPPLGIGNDRGRLSMEVVRPAEHWMTHDQILMIPLDGLVREGDTSTYFGEVGMLVELKDRLLAAERNRRIKAIVLRIDSPGGTVTAADLIHQELERFKERTGLPVIAHLNATAASGGLYIAMAADEIYALPTTLTGSIGVIVTLPKVHKLADKIGFEMAVVKSGENKDLGSPWQPMSPAERAIFQNIIDNYYARFLDVILASRAPRGMTEEGLRALADGRVFGPETALEAKLIDGILYPDAVFDRAEELAGIADAEIITYEYPYTWRGNIYARSDSPNARPPAAGGDLNLIKLELGQIESLLGASRFHYLWLP